MATYTDQKQVHGKTIWFDAELENWDLVNEIAEKSENWLDFITGANQLDYVVTALPNGTYSIDKKSSITRFTLRIPEPIYGKIWERHSQTRESINSIILEILEKELK